MQAIVFGFTFLLVQFFIVSQNALAGVCVDVSTSRYAAKGADFSEFVERAIRSRESEQAGPTSSARKEVRVILSFHEPLDRLRLAQLIPGRIVHELPLVNSVSAIVPLAALDELARAPEVRSLELDATLHAFPDTPTARADQGLTEVQVTPPGITRSHAPEAWAKTKGKGTLVAIIDTGVDGTHPELAARVVGGKNLTSPQTEDWRDRHGHGTHVAGTIAANDNGLGVVGMAPEASLLAVKVLSDEGSGTAGDVVAGIEYAIQAGAKVMNLSLGSASDIEALHEAIRKAQNGGVFVAAASGNSGESFGNPLHYPAAYPEAVAVAALDENGSRAYFSTYNRFVALAAPGVNVLSLAPQGAYAEHSGTSMATPHVAGAAALINSAFPEISLAELKHRVVCGAQPRWPGPRNIWTGYGALDVMGALEGRASADCVYPEPEVTEPILSPPGLRPRPAPEEKVVYVRETAFALINDGFERQLQVTVRLTDATGKPIANTPLTSEVMEYHTGPLATATTKTDSKGEAQFVLSGFSCGQFRTRIVRVGTPEFSDAYGQPEAETWIN